MPSKRIQINLTYTLPDDTAETMEELSAECERQLATVARMLLKERVTLLRSGWQLSDKRIGEILQEVCSLTQEDQEKVGEFAKTLRPRS